MSSTINRLQPNQNECSEKLNEKLTDNSNLKKDEYCKEKESNFINNKRKRSHSALLKATWEKNPDIITCTYQPSKETNLIFGSTTLTLFDTYKSILDKALVKGVESLPFLPTSHQTIQLSIKNISKAFHNEYEQDMSKNGNKIDDGFENEAEGGDDKLLEMLRVAYAKNIEKAEIYALRNIFSLNDLPRSKRIQLLDAFENDVDPDILDASINSDGNSHSSKIFFKNEDEEPMINDQHLDTKGNSTKNDAEKKLHLPLSVHDVPTPDQIQTIEEEMQDIRIDLLQKKRIRNILVQQLQLIKQSETTVQNINQSIKTSIENIAVSSHEKINANHSDNQKEVRKTKESKDNLDNYVKGTTLRNIKDIVTSTMIQQNQLEHLTQHAHNLKERMNQLKEKNNSAENGDCLNALLVSRSKKKSYELSLDDHFQAMKNRLELSDSSPSDIQKLLTILKK